MSTVWITHAGTGGVAEVDESALPIYRQSGWDLLSKTDLAAREKAALDEAAAAEQAMAQTATPALPDQPADTEPGGQKPTPGKKENG